MSHIHSHNNHIQNHCNRVDGYHPRTEGYDPKKFKLPSEDFTPMPLPHVDRVDLGVHPGWDPTLIRPTFAK